MAAFFAVLLGSASILLGYFLYDFGHQNFIRETEAAIDNEIDHMLSIRDENDTAAFVSHIKNRSNSSNNPIYLYRSKEGEKLAGNLDGIPKKAERIKEGVIQFAIKRNDSERVFSAKIHTLSNGSTLLIARDIHEMIESYEKLKIFSIFIIIFMLIVVLVSFFISVFVVSRINRISYTAQHIIDTGDLSQRISVDSNWDDLSDLARTLNNFLERIESLMQGVRDVSDSIAHDLRTPLTRLRNQLENARRSPLNTLDITTLLSEADNMLETFNALLRISNIEKGKRHQAFSPVELAVILHDVIELYEPLAEEKNISINVSYAEASSIMGDRDLLFQLFANVLDNAIKFSPPEGTISIATIDKGKKLQITIADQGIGIPKTESEKVFNRFYRTEKSRNTLGNGLGLSLVKAIVEVHSGSATLHNNNPGLKIAITFEHYQ